MLPMTSVSLARLVLDWLNERYGTSFRLAGDDTSVATEGDRRVGLHVAPLWEEDRAWHERLTVIRARLDGLGLPGAYLLWLPPRADVPAGEPEASSFIERVRAAASSLSPGARTEVRLPATVKLAKLRDEGGYASVTGGLSRWWTRITENVQGTFAVDSSAVHRITHDGVAREELWQTIGRLSNGVSVGQTAEFEIDEAWTLQRLADAAAPGFALVGAPPSVDPSDGVLVRRMARKRLAAANDALTPLEVDIRIAGLIGGYEYMEVETASGTLKAIDPSLYSRLEVVCLLADGEVKPVFAPRALEP
jgi:hypothetical protein